MTGSSTKSSSSVSSGAPTLQKQSKSESTKKGKGKGETSFIIEEMMDQGIAKGDINLSDGTGTDNMTCIIVQFRDPEDVL